MANENKNTTQLVSQSDEDATDELPELTLQHALVHPPADAELEDDADTFEIERFPGRKPSSDVHVVSSELESRATTVSRLQFDVERLRSRLTGLQSEVRAREDISDDLNRRIAQLEGKLSTSATTLRQRDKTIRDLKAEIRTRAADAREVEDKHASLRVERDRLESELSGIRSEIDDLKALRSAGDADASRRGGQQTDAAARSTELSAQVKRTEAYADQIRRQLQDKTDEVAGLQKTLAHTQLELQETTTLVENLEAKLRSQGEDNRALAEQIGIMQQRHNDDLRQTRIDLKVAEDTLNQHLLVNEQLAADLEESRAYRERMEQMLSRSDDEYRQTIAGLEQDVAELSAARTDLEAELAKRTDAVNTLLAELSNRNDRHEDIELRATDATPKDRVNRMLIGYIEDQELRFPLFKDRLTIGRTQQNDIQLNVPYISRRHAVVITEGKTTRVVDWGSRNGVFVNAKRVTEHFLKSGDRITIGNADFRYEERPRRDA